MPSSAEMFWRAATYLSAAQLYLQDNFLLEDPLEPLHLKPEAIGHWGTSPGITFAYAHLSDFVRWSRRNTILVLGPGHAAPALYACTYLDGTLAEVDPKFAHGRSGLAELVSGFARPGGLDTEVSAFAPGVLHSGGELGPALAIAQGAAIDAPGVTVACVVGDGELETGPAASAWLGVRQLPESGMGDILPIVNLNRLRMGGRSLLGRMSEPEIHSYFHGLGYKALMVGTSHVSMRQALSEADLLLRHQASSQPVVVVDTPKGWSGPIEFDGCKICGSPASHKAPFPDPANDAAQMASLETWLRSYRPAELFDEDGVPRPDVLRCLPSQRRRLGACARLEEPVEALPLLSDPPAPNNTLSPAAAVGARMVGIGAPGSPRVFRVFCPDELTSNRLDSLGENGLAVEILSEHLCHGWLNGYLQTGRHGLLVTYEAFAPIFGSMTTQYLKFLAGARREGWRAPRASLNLFLTSLGWNNCYTHQNPGFLDTVLTGEFPFVRVYTPTDATSAVAALDESLSSRDRVNVLVAGKWPVPVHRSEEEARADLEAGAVEWDLGTQEDDVDVVVGVAGDRLCTEAALAIELLRSEVPALRVRLVAVNELTCLGDPDEYEAALANERFESLFPRQVPVVFPFIGYASTLARLIFRRPGSDRFQIQGFRGEAGRSTTFMALVRCGVDRFSLAARVASTALRSRPSSRTELERFVCAMEQVHVQYQAYVREARIDPEWVSTDGADAVDLVGRLT